MVASCFDRHHAGRADRRADRAARDRQHQALGQDLTDDASAAGAEREPDRDLALTRRAAREQQVRDVRADDDQQHGHRHEKDAQRRFQRGDDAVLDGLDGEARTGQRRRDAGRGGRMAVPSAFASSFAAASVTSSRRRPIRLPAPVGRPRSSRARPACRSRRVKPSVSWCSGRTPTIVRKRVSSKPLGPRVERLAEDVGIAAVVPLPRLDRSARRPAGWLRRTTTIVRPSIARVPSTSK